jgi:hypothetical protein
VDGCCGVNEIAFQPNPNYTKQADCYIAAGHYCGANRKCCEELLYGIDSNDYQLVNNMSAMKAVGVHFVVRYVSNFYYPVLRGITPEEAASYRAANMTMVAVWETTRIRPIEGGSPEANYANGVIDAENASVVMHSLGAGKKPVYYAVDAFVDSKNYAKLPPYVRIRHVADVIPYFQGIIATVGLNLTGAYGSYTLIKGLFDRNLIKYGWQASSFDSNGRLDPRSQLYQCNTYPPDAFGSDQVDYDLALRKDYGQFP